MVVYHLNMICMVTYFLIFWVNPCSSYEISSVYEKIEVLDVFDYIIFIESILKIENFNRSEWSTIVSKIDNKTRINFPKKNISDGICSMLIQSSLPDNSRVAQIYAQALEKAGEVSKSWECYRVINHHLNKKIFLHSTILNFQFRKLSRITTELKIKPIFIIGFHFSGADIVENIIGKCMGNLSILNNDQLLGLKRNIEIELLQLKNMLLQDNQLTHPEDFLNIRNEHAQNINDYLQSNLFSNIDDKVNGNQFYIHNLDHIPDNYELAPFLHLLFPDSPTIHVVNDPMDTILKCYQKSSTVVTAVDTTHTRWLFDLDDILYHYKSYLKAMELFHQNIPSNLLLHLPYPLFHHKNETLLSVIIQSLLEYILPEKIPTYPSISDIVGYTQAMIDRDPPPGYWIHYQNQLNDITLLFNFTLTNLFNNGHELIFIKYLNWMANPLFNYLEYYTMLFNSPDTSIFSEIINSRNKSNCITTPCNNNTNIDNNKICNQELPDSSPYIVTTSFSNNISDVMGNSNITEFFHLNDTLLLELGYFYHEKITTENLTEIRAYYHLLPLQDDNYMVNDLLALAYSHISNNNNLVLAEVILTRIITLIPNAWSASLGLSKILTATQRYQEAIDLYSSLPLSSLPQSLVSTVYRERAELYLQVSQYANAVEDYDKLLEMNPNDLETIQNRGTLYFNGKFFNKAYIDFIKLHSISPSQLTCYYIGLIESRRGHVENAVIHFDLALAYDPLNYQLHILKAHTLMEGGKNWKESFSALDHAISIDPTNAYSYTFRGLLYYNLGLSELALADIDKSLELSPNDNIQCIKMKAVALHSLGRLAEAMDVRTDIHIATADRFNWYSREMIAFWLIHLHDDFSTFNIFSGIDPNTRLMGWSQLTTSPDLDWNSVTSIIETVPIKSLTKNRNGYLKVSKRGQKLLQMTASIGLWIQLDAMGFLPNIKQYRMFGLCVLEMAQAIRKHVALIKQGKKEGLMMPHSTSSRSRVEEVEGHDVTTECMLDNSCESPTAYHSLGYRDLADIALKWRQLSEPAEVVIWFDCMPHNTSLDFAQVTHLVAGQAEVMRYFTYVNKTIESMKAALMTDNVYTGDTIATSTRLYLNDQQRENITAAATYQDIYHAVNQSFWVKLAVRSTIRPQEFLGGTDLVLKTINPDGYAFAIRTPYEINRSHRFDEELNEAFQRYLDVLLKHLDKKSLKKKKKNKKYLELLNKHSLEIFYYWINLGATTRGTAVIGYAILYATFLASNRRMKGKMPENRQLDWEALLHAEPDNFFQEAQLWINNLVPSTFSNDMMEGRVAKYDVRSVFSTPADIISGLSMLGTGTVETEEIFNADSFY